MADPAQQPTSYADLEAVHPQFVAEIIHGALTTHPQLSAVQRLLGALRTKFAANEWFFATEPQLCHGDESFVPALGGWRIQRGCNSVHKTTIRTSPDWVCDIVTAGIEGYVRSKKRDFYGMAGIEHLWLLNPEAKYLETFHLTNGRWAWKEFVCHSDQVNMPPFDAAPFSLGLLWPFDEPVDPGKPPI